MIFASRGINQHTNSVQANRVLMFLAAITGNWGRPGGAYFNMSAGTPIAPNAPDDRRPKISRPMIRRSPTGWTEAMRVGKPYPIKALIACNNPMSRSDEHTSELQSLMRISYAFFCLTHKRLQYSKTHK